MVDHFGYWGIGIGMLLESACIPIPSELVLPLGGFMVSEGRITMLEANISVGAGSMIGSLLAYAVGYFGGRPFILKYGKFFFISKEHFYKAEKLFNKYGSMAVFVGRLLPVIRTFISLPSGISRMSLKKFIVYSMTGMIFWNFILIYLGFKFGQNYETTVRPIFQKFEYGVIGIIAAAVLYFIYKLIKGSKTTYNT